jgi:acyl-CoA dehydrogenase
MSGTALTKSGKLTLPWHARTAELRSAVRDLTSRFSLEYWDQCEENKQFPEEFFRAFADGGWLGVTIPEQYGGGGFGLAYQAAVMEEVAASGGALDACTSVHTALLWVPVLLQFGTEEQKEKYLPDVAKGNLYVTFGVTEAEAGTDTTRISTSAARTDDGWVIRGQKVWNSGALRGDKVLLLARTQPRPESGKVGRGLTLFLVDLDSPGIEIRPIRKYTRNSVASCELFLDDVVVPEDRLLGQVDEGFYHIVHSLNGERLLLSAVAIGMARWAIEASVRYANDRVVFDRPIGANQGVQHPIAEAYIRLVAAAELLDDTLAAYDRKDDVKKVGTMATAVKWLTSEVSFFANDRAMQTFGGFAVAREYGVGRFWAESRIQRLAPLANELALSHVAEHALGLPRSY